MKNFLSGHRWMAHMGVSLVIMALMTHCSNSRIEQSLQSTPSAFGNINDLAVIIDSSLWTSPVGDSIDYYYAAAYPIMPQPEPIYDLRPLTPHQLRANPLLRELRHYLIVADMSDEYSETAAMIRQDMTDEQREEARKRGYGLTVGRNKWAKGQQLIYLYAYSREDLVEAVVNGFSAVAKQINTRENERREATLFFSGENRSLMDSVQQSLGVRMRIPRDFRVVPVANDSVVWLRKDIEDGVLNIMLVKNPYRDQSQLTKAGTIELIEQLGRRYVSSNTNNSYMKVDTEDLPIFTEVMSIGGSYTLETRGIWEMENAFLAGPFISYTIYNEAKPDLLFANAFILAPGKNKRDWMQELEYIVNTIRY